MPKKRSILSSLWKMIHVFLYAFQLLWAAYWHFEKLTPQARNAELQKRAKRLLSIIGVSVDEQGHKLLGKNCLRATNHVSWLDIVVHYAAEPCRFIAKSEIKQYPLIGKIAVNSGTFFLNRRNIKDAIRISQEMGQALSDGDCIAFFPEGTTSYGEGLLPMHPSLFESAVYAQSMVQGVALRYHSGHSKRALPEAAYVHSNIISCLWRVLRHGDVKVMLMGLEPFQVSDADARRDICQKIQKGLEEQLKALNYGLLSDFVDAQGKIDAQGLQKQFLIDLPIWADDGQIKLNKLGRSPLNKRLLAQVRQGFHLLRGGAESIAYKNLTRAAVACEESLDVWIQNKEAPTLELMNFCRVAFDQFSLWHTELTLGDIQANQASDLIKKAQVFYLENKTNKNDVYLEQESEY